ncbi:MAG: hypothetical protein FWD31_12210, partial [Planctomycetaceae bacterium]|nr:hypothetical protein [Planctomycetaceae bacterium]
MTTIMTTPNGRTLQSRRNGVILLLVLAMLAMFAMLIATFLVVSSQQYRMANSGQKIERYVHSPKDDLHSTLIQMLVGSHAKTSVIRAHSLGATMYGDANVPGLRGMVIWDSVFGANDEITRLYLNYSLPATPPYVPPDSVVDFLAN